jgi:hypothetical protein
LEGEAPDRYPARRSEGRQSDGRDPENHCEIFPKELSRYPRAEGLVEQTIERVDSTVHRIDSGNTLRHGDEQQFWPLKEMTQQERSTRPARKPAPSLITADRQHQVSSIWHDDTGQSPV